jgi:hypothetical protein
MGEGFQEAGPILPGGGAAGDTLRAFEWSRSALGSPTTWPASLRAHVRAMLNTRQATCIFWGADYVNLHNEGFLPLLGEKHPRAMGQDAREVWSDAWPVVGALLKRVLSDGASVLFQDLLVPIVRGGRLEDPWWKDYGGSSASRARHTYSRCRHGYAPSSPRRRRADRARRRKRLPSRVAQRTLSPPSGLTPSGRSRGVVERRGCLAPSSAPCAFASPTATVPIPPAPMILTTR